MTLVLAVMLLQQRADVRAGTETWRFDLSYSLIGTLNRSDGARCECFARVIETGVAGYHLGFAKQRYWRAEPPEASAWCAAVGVDPTARALPQFRGAIPLP